MRNLSSQVAEQLNARLKNLRSTLSYMTLPNFMFVLRLVISGFNIEKQEALVVTDHDPVNQALALLLLPNGKYSFFIQSTFFSFVLAHTDCISTLARSWRRSAFRSTARLFVFIFPCWICRCIQLTATAIGRCSGCCWGARTSRGE
jgi:hypothetical protein